MIISHSKKYIYLASPKTASCSLTRVLRDSLSEEDYFSREYGSKHLAAIEARRLVGPKIWNEYFKFTIVRNPYDWVVSWYCYCKHLSLRFCLKTFGIGRGIERYLTRSSTYLKFESFLKHRAHLWASNQRRFCFDEKGASMVDYIGRYENLDAEFAFLSEKLGIQGELPKVNVSPRDEDRENGRLLTPLNRKIIYNALKRDFEILQYQP